MKYFFYFLSFLIMQIIQNTIFKDFELFSHFYDLSLVLVIYASLFLPFYESLLIVAIIGILTDSLSSCPFFLHASIYFWITLVIKMVYGHFDYKKIVLPAIIFAVLCENIAFLILSNFMQNTYKQDLYLFFIKNLMFNVLWAILTGYIIFKVLRLFDKKMTHGALNENNEEYK